MLQHRSDGLANPPYLLVDGYNVIFEARAVNGQSRGQMDSDLLDTYRRDLELNLTNFSHKRGTSPSGHAFRGHSALHQPLVVRVRGYWLRVARGGGDGGGGGGDVM